MGTAWLDGGRPMASAPIPADKSGRPLLHRVILIRGVTQRGEVCLYQLSALSAITPLQI